MIIQNPILVSFQPQQTIDNIFDARAGLELGDISLGSLATGNVQQLGDGHIPILGMRTNNVA